MPSQRPAAARGWLTPTLMLRMASMLFMLGVIGLTIANLRQRAALAPQQAEQGAVPATEKAKPAPHTVTELADPDTPGGEAESAPSLLDRAVDDENADTRDDRNADERAAFARDSDVILDDELLISKAEIPSYRRLFQWVNSQSAQELAARDPQVASFQQLKQHPNKYRGKLVTLELLVRRVERDPETVANPVGVEQVYQLWGWPTSGRGWLYNVVTPELPPGFPEGENVTQTVRVYGYFFKLQGYQPGNAKPNAPPLVAPLIVGKLVWQPTVRTMDPGEAILSWIALAGGVAVVMVVVSFWIIGSRRKKTTPRYAIPYANQPSGEENEYNDSEYADSEDDEPDDKPPRGAFDWVRDE